MVSSIAVRPSDDLRTALVQSLQRLGPDTLADLAHRRILVKANFNSSHRYPASSALDFLAALVAVLKDAGAATIRIGDSCGLRWAPADRVAERLGIPRLAAQWGVEWVNFDAGPWTEIPVPGRHFPVVKIATAAQEAERIIYSCCVKTHRVAGFSASLKHAVGFLPPEQRRAMHDGDMARRIAEINLAVRPHLILADVRKCFTAGGPALGWVRRPGFILAATDRVEMDLAALAVLTSFVGCNRLGRDSRMEPQIREALALGIGRGTPANPAAGREA